MMIMLMVDLKWNIYLLITLFKFLKFIIDNSDMQSYLLVMIFLMTRNNVIYMWSCYLNKQRILDSINGVHMKVSFPHLYKQHSGHFHTTKKLPVLSFNLEIQKHVHLLIFLLSHYIRRIRRLFREKHGV